MKKILVAAALLIGSLVAGTSVASAEPGALDFGIVEIRPCGDGCYDVLFANGHLTRIFT